MNGRSIVMGITGGIAAYKTAMLCSRLVQSGATVRVVMTKTAERFIGAPTLAALTGHRVVTDMFDDDDYPLGPHISLAENADLLCVAPATANFLAKAAMGLADDLLSTLYLAFPGKVLFAPAMNSTMWEQPAVQRNIQRLREDGVVFVEPEEGWLSCRRTGKGRMAEPDVLLAAIEQHLGIS